MGKLVTPRADRTKVTDPSKRRAPRQEREIAKQIGGRTTAASGSRDEKGDVRAKGIARIEAKCTRRKSFSIKLETIEKIEDAATATVDGEIPMMHIEFLTPEGQRLKGVYLVPEAYAEDLLRGAINEGSDTNVTGTRGNRIRRRRRST